MARRDTDAELIARLYRAMAEACEQITREIVAKDPRFHRHLLQSSQQEGSSPPKEEK